MSMRALQSLSIDRETEVKHSLLNSRVANMDQSEFGLRILSWIGRSQYSHDSGRLTPIPRFR